MDEEIITLEEYENRNGCLASYEAAAIIKLLCVALDKLHRDKITYRELCPANILLVCGNGQQEGRFTEVRLAESAAPRKYREGAAEDTVLMGIERYAAPEQYGFAQSTPATDIFAAGVLFNEMLTGKAPEEERTDEPVCASIIEKCCSLDWQKRYKNVKALMKDIEWYLSHRKSGRMAWNIHKHREFMAAGAAFLVLCILLGAGFAVHSVHNSDSKAQIQKKPVGEQKEEMKEEVKEEIKEEYQKYTLDSREIVVYYPEGFHYAGKTEKEGSVLVNFASNTGDTGMITMAVMDNDWTYSLEEGAEILLQEIISMYPGGKVISQETGEEQAELYYKFPVDKKDFMAGVQIRFEQNNEKLVAVLGIYDAEEEKYKEYFDTMIEKIEYQGKVR